MSSYNEIVAPWFKKFVDHAASLRKVEYVYYDIHVFIQINLALHFEIKFYSQKIT